MPVNEGNPTFPAAQTLARDEDLTLGTTITTFAASDTDSVASGHSINSYTFAGEKHHTSVADPGLPIGWVLGLGTAAFQKFCMSK